MIPDYIIVGAGSAGCVIAHRLAEAGYSVKLIDSGRSNSGSWDKWKINMPSALTFMIGSKKYNYDYYTTPQKGLNNRRIHQPLGKLLGGGSSINAMAYVRGHAEDYQRWARILKDETWSYNHVLPYFIRSQSHTQGANKYRGDKGPLIVTRINTKLTKELNAEFLKAATKTGYPYTDDQNGYQQEGFSPMDMTIDPRTGKRASAAYCYLNTEKYQFVKDKVSVETLYLVKRLLFDYCKRSSVGVRKVRGVEIEDKNGRSKKLLAKREVILCAGAVGSTKLLQLSGVGDSDYLKNLGVESHVHLPDVGLNLNDHLEFYLQYLCKKPVSFASYASTFKFSPYAFRRPELAAKVGLEWMLRGKGLCASNQFEVGGFIRSRADPKHILHPDIQLHFTAACAIEHLSIVPKHGYQAHIGTLRPTSRGTIKIISNNPKDSPLIDPNYLATNEDVADQRNAFRLGVELMENFDTELQGERFNFSKGLDLDNDEAIDSFIRETSHSGYHLCGTNAMGKVVDPKTCEVFGCKNLRVVDASVMPDLISGNINAPVIMLAEKMSDVIIEGRELLPPLGGVDWYKADCTTQR